MPKYKFTYVGTYSLGSLALWGRRASQAGIIKDAEEFSLCGKYISKKSSQLRICDKDASCVGILNTRAFELEDREQKS